VGSPESGEKLAPDISIKQAWIYGGWMKALERDTILEAVVVQERLLGPILNYGIGNFARRDPSDGRMPTNSSAQALTTFHSFIRLCYIGTAPWRQLNQITLL
jgi:hypothetical protein